MAGTATTVTVESAGELLETTSTAHVDVSCQLFEKLPLESASSSLSSLVTEASPGVAADSNGHRPGRASFLARSSGPKRLPCLETGRIQVVVGARCSVPLLLRDPGGLRLPRI